MTALGGDNSRSFEEGRFQDRQHRRKSPATNSHASVSTMILPFRVSRMPSVREQQCCRLVLTLGRVLSSSAGALALLLILACSRDVISVDVGGVILNVASTAATAPVDSWRVTISGPSGSQTRTAAPGGSIEFSSLEPGAYTVLIEGFEGPDLASRGQNTVTVRAGSNSTANVALTPVLPTIGVVASDPIASEVGPDAGTFTITRNGPTSAALTLNFSLSGTASAGNDYQAISSPVTMAAGQRFVTINVLPQPDTQLEGVETVVLTVTAGSGYELTSSVSSSVTIADAPVLPIVNVFALDAEASEVGPNTGTFRLERTGSLNAPLTVGVTLAGQASNGVDYATIATVLTIPAGQAFLDVVVAPVLDRDVELGGETVSLSLAPSLAYTFGPSTLATVTIADAPVVTVVATDSSASEIGPDPGVFTISRSGPTTTALTVIVATSGNAISGTDYIAIAATQTIPAGAASITVAVSPVQDAVDGEGDELVFLTIVPSVVYGVGAPSVAAVVIAPASAGGEIVSTAAGDNHTCGLTQAGIAHCWGSNLSGQLGDGTTSERAVPVSVIGGLTFTAVAAGSSHTCGLTSTGQGHCWGANNFGQLGDGSTALKLSPTLVSGGTIFQSLSAGGRHTCGIATTGDVYCWGANYAGQLGDGSFALKPTPVKVSGSQKFVSIASGSEHSCALTLQGAAYCWGNNLRGQLGNGSINSSGVPIAVAGGLTFQSLVADGDHTCGLTATAAYCWGLNSAGQLGDGSTNSTAVPTDVAGGHTFVSLAAGQEYTCGLTRIGQPYCWGRNDFGQLGDGLTENSSVPRAVIGGRTFAFLVAGQRHSCGVTSVGAAYCWGDNSLSQLGTGAPSNLTSPTAVSGGSTFTSLGAGDLHTCGRTNSGVVYCWGLNGDGQLGDLSTINRGSPSLTAGVQAFTSIVAGGNHSCGTVATGTSFCWGLNARGQLGDGGVGGFLRQPTAVVGGQTFASLAAGDTHSCGLTSSGAAYCWGSNSFGELGDGTVVDRPAPAVVLGGRLFSRLVAGDGFTCGVTNSAPAAAYCWGRNASGQLGDGSFTNRSVPTAVSGGVSFLSIVAGDAHTCALSISAEAFCWGNNFSGQLGDGSGVTNPLPTVVSGGRTYASLVAGGSHSCGRTNNGAVFCWGDNDFGQLGDGMTGDRTTPSQVSGGRSFVSLAAGNVHTCGLTDIGEAFCWGADSRGQLGVGRLFGRQSLVVGGIIFKVP